MTTKTNLWTDEEVKDQAYEVFLQLAPDNFKQQDIDDFNQYREDLGFIEESEPDDSWNEFVEFEVEADLYVQVIIGLEFENHDVEFARLLISRDKDAPFCHVIWKQ